MEMFAVTGTLLAALGLCSMVEAMSDRDLRTLPPLMFAYGLTAIVAFVVYS